MHKEYDKMMIKLSVDNNEADKYLEMLGLLSLDEKITYLQCTFDVQLISRKNTNEIAREENKNMDYYALLHTILNTN